MYLSCAITISIISMLCQICNRELIEIVFIKFYRCFDVHNKK